MKDVCLIKRQIFQNQGKMKDDQPKSRSLKVLLQKKIDVRNYLTKSKDLIESHTG